MRRGKGSSCTKSSKPLDEHLLLGQESALFSDALRSCSESWVPTRRRFDAPGMANFAQVAHIVDVSSEASKGMRPKHHVSEVGRESNSVGFVLPMRGLDEVNPIIDCRDDAAKGLGAASHDGSNSAML